MCGWEDDHVQLAYPTMRGGANGESLYEAQLRTLKEFPLHATDPDYEREVGWRPLLESEVLSAQSGPNSGIDYFQSAVDEQPRYYWRRDA